MSISLIYDYDEILNRVDDCSSFDHVCHTDKKENVQIFCYSKIIYIQ